MNDYLPIGLVIFFIAGLMAVNKEITKRPTWKEANKKFTDKDVCKVVHKSVDEKLACLPDIKKSVTQIETKIDIFLEANGKK